MTPDAWVKQQRRNWRTCCIGARKTLGVHSPGGITFLREIMSWSPFWNCHLISQIGLLSIDAYMSPGVPAGPGIYLQNNPAIFNPNGAIGFFARDSVCAICYRPSVRPSVCLSVRLSVTRVDQSKTVAVRIMRPSPQSSSGLYSFLTLNFTAKFQREHGAGGAKWQRGMKNTQFSANKSQYLRNGAR